MNPTLLAICTSSNKGVPKYPQPVATVGTWGLEGDYHNLPTRWSYKRAIAVPNTDRHILLVDQDDKDDIARTIKIVGGTDRFLEHGSLSENILVQGLGRLSLIELVGRRVAIGGRKVILHILEPAQPCKHVRARYGLDVYESLQNRRGMYCTIESGRGKQISLGDKIEFE